MEQSINKVRLENRSVIRLSGMDVHSFLQGLVTNDMEKVSQSRSIYALLLTAQGKFSHDLFITKLDGHYLIDAERERIPELLKKLKLYKLRSDVKLEDVSQDYSVWALWGEDMCADFEMDCTPGNTRPYEGGVLYADPRHMEMGFRVMVPHKSEKNPDVDPNPLEHHPNSEEDPTYTLYADKSSLNNLTTHPEPPAWMIAHLDASLEDYEKKRLSLGIPDAPLDMIPEKSIPLECNVDQLNAISMDKGCYLGQELIARTSHRGLVRKRLLPVKIDGEPAGYDADLYLGDKKVGSMRSACGDLGLALIRLEALEEGEVLTVKDSETTVTPKIPVWLKV